MTGEFGHLGLRDDRPNWIPVQAGDPVTMYTLGEPWHYGDLAPHEGCSQELDEYQTFVVQHANSEDDWRVQDLLRCDCKQRRVVAQVLVHLPSARLWATAKPERVPMAFRKADHGAVEGWALHGKPGEAPHVGAVSSCKGCDKRWLVLSFPDRAELLHIAAATHGATIAP